MILSVLLSVAISAPVAPGRESWRGEELLVQDRFVRDFEQLQHIAFKYLGRAYVRGGSGDPGFDCSGFSCRVFAEAGYAIPRTSFEQSRFGKAVRLDALMPGDLLFFAQNRRRVDHVGVYLGDRVMIHSASGEGRVMVSNIDSPWFKRRLVGARRVLGVMASEEPAVIIACMLKASDTFSTIFGGGMLSERLAMPSFTMDATTESFVGSLELPRAELELPIIVAPAAIEAESVDMAPKEAPGFGLPLLASSLIDL